MSIDNNFYLIKHMCRLPNFFTNFDNLAEDTLQLNECQLSGTVLSVNNNLNPVHHNNRSELHAFRMVYKTTLNKDTNLKRYYAIGYKLVTLNNENFIYEPNPLIYSFTVLRNTCVAYSYKEAHESFNAFCRELPLVIEVKGYQGELSLLNRNDGDFIKEIFNAAKTSNAQFKSDARHVIDFVSERIIKGRKINELPSPNLIRKVFNSCNVEETFPINQLANDISVECQPFRYKQSFHAVNDQFERIVADIFLRHYFLNLISTAPSVDQSESHTDIFFCNCRPCTFSRSIEASSFFAQLDKVLLEAVENPNSNSPLIAYVQSPSPATKYALLEYIDSRILIPKRDRRMVIDLDKNDYTPYTDPKDTQLFAEIVNKYREAKESISTQDQDNFKNQNTGLNTGENMLQIIGTTEVFLSTETSDLQTSFEPNATATTDITKTPAQEAVTLEEIPIQNNISDSLDTQSTISDADEAIELQEQDTAQTIEDTAESLLQEETPAPVIPKAYLQYSFNSLDLLTSAPLPLIQTINGSKKINLIDLDELNIFPYQFKVYDKDSKSYKIQTHVISLAYKEYFTKDKKEDGMINYLGYGHEILFNGEEYAVSQQTNVYAIHQRKGKIVAVALIDYLSFQFDKPANLPLNSKQIVAPLAYNTPSSKTLLEFLTKNRSVFVEVAEQITQAISDGFENYLKDTGRSANLISAIRFAGYSAKDSEGIEYASLSSDYKAAIESEVSDQEDQSAVAPTAPQQKPIASNSKQTDSQIIHTDVVKVGDDKNKISIFIEPSNSSLPEPTVEELSSELIPELDYIHTNPPKNVQQDVPKTFSSIAKAFVAEKPVEPVEAVVDVVAEPKVEPAQPAQQPAAEAPAPANLTASEAVNLGAPSIKNEDVQDAQIPTQLVNGIFNNLPQVDLSDAQAWVLHTELGYDLKVMLKKDYIAFSIQDTDSTPVVFELDNFLSREGHYYLFTQMTNKATAKLVRKFIKLQMKQNLFNLFKPL